jgi:hypothetical protein
MKFTKAYIILIILCLSQCSSILRTERKAKSKAKNDGSGSWDTGYECPGIELLDEAQIKNSQKTWTTAERVSFKPKDMQSPPENKKLGIFFTITDPSQKLRKILVDAGANTFYLPYRYVSSKFNFQNPFNDYKVIEGSVTNDLNQTFLFRLKLPYKTFGWFIDDKQMQTLCDLINNNREAHQTIVKNTKSVLLSSAGIFIQNQLQLDQNTRDANNLEALKTFMIAQIGPIKETIDSDNIKLSDLSILIAKLTAELNQKKSEFNDLNNKVNSLGLQHQELVQKISILEGDEKTKKTFINDITKKKDTSKTQLVGAFETLKKEVPYKTNEITQSETEITNEKKSDKLVLTLGSIYS